MNKALLPLILVLLVLVSCVPKAVETPLVPNDEESELPADLEIEGLEELNTDLDDEELKELDDSLDFDF